ncbi:hypothetical protein WOLCODRAFT_148013 [Wolfiporia cocos MD-104 SS10]|uniref:Uncharacterized protein n=1 Tax=Wolfiporia cocos (strain MD-104) TaxID=742152 RepID=A0A2H3J8H9_WOLCO|nr:hypothetical protein WOLCODRAFT_148013 [Wolfiporia cocos MD-104 SS10]
MSVLLWQQTPQLRQSSAISGDLEGSETAAVPLRNMNVPPSNLSEHLCRRSHDAGKKRVGKRRIGMTGKN